MQKLVYLRCVKDDPLPGAVLPTDEELIGPTSAAATTTGGGGALEPIGDTEGSFEAIENRGKLFQTLTQQKFVLEAVAKARLIERAKGLLSKGASASLKLREQTLQVNKF